MTSKQSERIGWPTILGLGGVVGGMMVLALCMTATGTARFMAPMGYDIKVGYGVGITLELAKDVLPVAVLALWTRRAHGRALAIGAAWLFGVVFSCLATHATVTTAISSIERTGTWKMEVRTNAKTELASIEQQLAALSQPAPPRPMKTVREGLAATSVPPAIWKDSQECAEIQGSAYFARACAQVVQLRRELAASEDYERLTVRAGEIRKALAEAPILATADPLPMAFSATFGRFVPIGGMDGVALLLTALLELISGFGLAALTALYSARDPGTPEGACLAARMPETGEGASQSVAQQAPSPSHRPKSLNFLTLLAAPSRICRGPVGPERGEPKGSNRGKGSKDGSHPRFDGSLPLACFEGAAVALTNEGHGEMEKQAAASMVSQSCYP
jgi:hypothetical protein